MVTLWLTNDLRVLFYYSAQELLAVLTPNSPGLDREIHIDPRIEFAALEHQRYRKKENESCFRSLLMCIDQ